MDRLEAALQAGGQLSERIARKLEDAIDRLNDDFDRVEFWAAALNAFLQPVPPYEAPPNDFLLPGKDREEERPEAGRPSSRRF